MPFVADPANVVISTVNYDGLVKRTEADEYIELTNTGGSSVDISGWQIKRVKKLTSMLILMLDR